MSQTEPNPAELPPTPSQAAPAIAPHAGPSMSTQAAPAIAEIVAAELLPDGTSATPPQRIRRGFPLGALFLLITVCAVLAAHVMPVFPAFRASQISGQDAVIAAIVACLAASVLGLIVGLFQSRPVLGVFMGVSIGGGLGLMVGPVCLVPETDFARMFVASLVGSVVLLLFAVAMRVRD